MITTPMFSVLYNEPAYLSEDAMRKAAKHPRQERMVSVLGHAQKRKVVAVQIDFVRRVVRAKRRRPSNGAPTTATELRVVRSHQCFADINTGVLFCARTGKCLTSPQLRMEV